MEPNDSGGSGGALSRHIAPNHAAARAPPCRLPQHEPVEGPGRADRAPGLPRRGPLRGSRCAALPPFAAHQRPPRRRAAAVRARLRCAAHAAGPLPLRPLPLLPAAAVADARPRRLRAADRGGGGGGRARGGARRCRRGGGRRAPRMLQEVIDCQV
jgi:hypothetical protein